MRVRQILLTYFNRRFREPYWLKALDDDWLEHRWELFNTFTVPSIAAQTCADFDWVILCHSDTPKWFCELTETLDLPCRVRFSFDVLEPAEGVIDAALDDLYDPSYDVILTARLDSDDALHRRAMARIRESFEADPLNYDIFFLEVGYKYDRLSQRLEIVKVPSSVFCAKVNRSPVVNPLDVGGEHHTLTERYRCCEISGGDPMFLQVIHEGNIMNRVSRRPCFLSVPLSRHILQGAFNIDDPIREMPLKSPLPDTGRLVRRGREKLGRFLRPDR